MSNDKLHVGFIGTGRISTLHQPFYMGNPAAELVAICDKNKKAVANRAKEWGLPPDKAYSDYHDLLRNPDIDAVEVLTPHATHKDIVVAACEAGKHVNLQKVPCMRLSDFDAMQGAARKAGVKLKIYENYQFHPPIRRALEIIRGGSLGKVTVVNQRMWNALLPLSAWKVSLRALIWRISERNNYKLPWLWDDGYHKHNLAHLFLGKDIEVVHAWNRGIRMFKAIKADIPAVITYKTKGTEYATYNVSVTNALPIRSDYYAGDEMVEIQCEKGIIWVNGCTGNMFVNCANGPGAPGVYWIDPKGEWHAECGMATNWRESFLACSRDFIDAIKEDRPPYRSGADARHVLQVDLAMVASLRSGFTDFRVSAITDGIPKNLAEGEVDFKEDLPEDDSGFEDSH